MAHRTFAVGDIHGDLAALRAVLAKLPPLDEDDTLVFLGDYLDRGPESRQVIAFVRHQLPKRTPAKIVALRGNHEDGWLRVRQGGWPEFVIPIGNGCLATMRSYEEKIHFEGDVPSVAEMRRMQDAGFFPEDVVTWMKTLPYFYEDAHAIYVHAGLDGEGATWRHPRDGAVKPLLWMREPDFYNRYEGKPVVFGHTHVKELPPELEDRRTPWRRGPLIGIDTGAGRGGPLTAIALPDGEVFQASP